MTATTVCGSPCPQHDHRCLRSPGHTTLCRDQKQKGTQSCDWDPKKIRPAVRELVRLVQFRQGLPKPCWIMRTQGDCALVVPAMYGPLEFLRRFRRPTVDEAERLGLVVLGALAEVPAFLSAPPSWIERGVTQGRTIAIPGGGE